MAQALALAKRPRGARLATLCERRWDFTQIKPMVTCCLDAIASGGNPQDRAASLIQKLIADS
ncbi:MULTISPECIES: hypothetical protein [unclassified Moorena]|uniref:hypothetical protein n=1 Tax=unclassified Moorena TaxID=2683338 RepID=UPI0013FF2AAC|nr:MULTISPECIES: hypothetical protein [unclassified Moorena]NEO17368.1 hypothetical protein [Moorena sp. SIO3E8]NEQ03940.1 hypothetical protein [Moorena sp. SIO3F7]